MTKADFIVVIFAFTLLPYLYINLWGESTAAEVAHIQAGKHDIIEVPLDTEQQLDIEGPLGTSVIKVAGGKARFVDSPCRGKQCIHSGWLDKSGEFAACLPNKISLTVTGHIPRFDAINF